MDDTTLTVIRGKLTALETGYLVEMLEPGEVAEEATALLTNHPNLPQAERRRAEALMLAVAPAAGKVM
jgi:hypothetical protein